MLRKPAKKKRRMLLIAKIQSIRSDPRKPPPIHPKRSVMLCKPVANVKKKRKIAKTLLRNPANLPKKIYIQAL